MYNQSITTYNLLALLPDISINTCFHINNLNETNKTMPARVIFVPGEGCVRAESTMPDGAI
jgi:hypothetical protein